MRKTLVILVPFILAVIVFSLVIFFLANNNQKGALQVTASPGSAKVYIDDKLIGQTPLCKCQPKDMLPVGVHTMKLVSSDGNFIPFVQKITIAPRVLTVVDKNFAQTGLGNGSIISLNPIDNSKDAQISIVTFPDNAQVYLDNNLEGQSPILLKNITESDHELKITKEGYKDKIVRIRTVLGYRLDALIFIGINPAIASGSASLNATSSSVLSGQKILILNTPTGFLRVRTDASIGSLEIGQVNPGETYDLLNEKDGWYEIKLTNGKTGWISSDYAQKQN